jgi:hypothetical protein
MKPSGELMANRSRPSQQKRHKERARQEKQKMKAERRQEAKSMRANMAPRQAGDIDPDIAGIVPGPQPPREDMLLDDEPEVEPKI